MRGLPRSMFWKVRATLANPKPVDYKVLVIAEPLAIYHHTAASLFLRGIRAVQGNSFFKPGGISNLTGPAYMGLSGVVIVANKRIFPNDVEDIIRHFGNIPILVLNAWGYVSIKSEGNVILSSYALRKESFTQFLGTIH